MNAQPGTPGSERGAVERIAAALADHEADVTSYDAGDIWGCRCDWELTATQRNEGYETKWPAYQRHVAEHLTQALAADREPLREAVERIETHNGTPVTAENLRYAATHEALCRSWIFDVLTGLADALDGPR